MPLTSLCLLPRDLKVIEGNSEKYISLGTPADGENYKVENNFCGFKAPVARENFCLKKHICQSVRTEIRTDFFINFTLRISVYSSAKGYCDRLT
jgi:hypothetical protein